MFLESSNIDGYAILAASSLRGIEGEYDNPVVQTCVDEKRSMSIASQSPRALGYLRPLEVTRIPANEERLWHESKLKHFSFDD